jgi:hypothetical protein
MVLTLRDSPLAYVQNPYGPQQSNQQINEPYTRTLVFRRSRVVATQNHASQMSLADMPIEIERARSLEQPDVTAQIIQNRGIQTR